MPCKVCANPAFYTQRKYLFGIKKKKRTSSGEKILTEVWASRSVLKEMLEEVLPPDLNDTRGKHGISRMKEEQQKC